jgi:hypothetical protein
MEKCTIDHAADGAIPKSLCVVCSPRPKNVKFKHVHESEGRERRRDFRIPKGMSTEDGNAMLAARWRRKQDLKMGVIERLRQKQRTELDRLNVLRRKSGLSPLPDEYVRHMKSDPTRNDRLFARADLGNGEPVMSTTKDITPAAPAKAAGQVPAKGRGKTPPKGDKPSAAPEKAADKFKASTRSTSTPKAGKRAGSPPKGGKVGAFTPEICDRVMAMLKKGTTAKAIIDAAHWEKCPNPLRRVNRFVETVAEGRLKTKVKVTGRGEEAQYVAS